MDYEKRVHDGMREIAARAWPNQRARSERWRPGRSSGGMLPRPRSGAKVTLPTAMQPELALVRRSARPAFWSPLSEPETNSAKLRRKFGVECPVIGVTMKERLQIGNGDRRC